MPELIISFNCVFKVFNTQAFHKDVRENCEAFMGIWYNMDEVWKAVEALKVILGIDCVDLLSFLYNHLSLFLSQSFAIIENYCIYFFSLNLCSLF